MAILLGRKRAEPGDRIGWIDLSESPFRTSAAHARCDAGRGKYVAIAGRSVTGRASLHPAAGREAACVPVWRFLRIFAEQK